MERIGTYKGCPIIKGALPNNKPVIGAGSKKGIDLKEEFICIFLHIGQKYKSNICMDSWKPEPAGWLIEFPSCYMVTSMIDGESIPYGLVNRLAEEHAIVR